MKLDDWLRTRNKTGAWLAAEIGIDKAAVSRIRAGMITPSLQTAVAIFRATDGDVKPHDLIARPRRRRGPDASDVEAPAADAPDISDPPFLPPARA